MRGVGPHCIMQLRMDMWKPCGSYLRQVQRRMPETRVLKVGHRCSNLDLMQILPHSTLVGLLYTSQPRFWSRWNRSVVDCCRCWQEVSASAHVGVTPLQIAAWDGQVEMVGLLISSGVDVNKTTIDHGITPLYMAALIKVMSKFAALAAWGWSEPWQSQNRDWNNTLAPGSKEWPSWSCAVADWGWGWHQQSENKRWSNTLAHRNSEGACWSGELADQGWRWQESGQNRWWSNTIADRSLGWPSWNGWPADFLWSWRKQNHNRSWNHTLVHGSSYQSHVEVRSACCLRLERSMTKPEPRLEQHPCTWQQRMAILKLCSCWLRLGLTSTKREQTMEQHPCTSQLRRGMLKWWACWSRLALTRIRPEPMMEQHHCRSQLGMAKLKWLACWFPLELT